jgi:hypothetical protein
MQQLSIKSLRLPPSPVVMPKVGDLVTFLNDSREYPVVSVTSDIVTIKCDSNYYRYNAEMLAEMNMRICSR